MKKTLVALLASAVCCAAHAVTSWHVVVTAGYLNSKQEFVNSIPVLDAVVDNDSCYYGPTRDIRAAGDKVIPTREQFCIKGPDIKREVNATVFVKDVVRDAINPAITVDLNAGQDIWLSYNGSFISFLTGPYLVTITKIVKGS
jgi:hypothetical protein